MVAQLVEAVEINLEGEKTIPLNRRLAAIASKFFKEIGKNKGKVLCRMCLLPCPINMRME